MEVTTIKKKPSAPSGGMSDQPRRIGSVEVRPMLNKDELDALSAVDITAVDPGTLTDLRGVKIEGDTPAQRLESYLVQIGNPYCFKVGTTPVKIKFAPDGKSLEEKLKKHFLSLKTGDFSPEL